jgi:hypothetical protein
MGAHQKEDCVVACGLADLLDDHVHGDLWQVKQLSNQLLKGAKLLQA